MLKWAMLKYSQFNDDWVSVNTSQGAEWMHFAAVAHKLAFTLNISQKGTEMFSVKKKLLMSQSLLSP